MLIKCPNCGSTAQVKILNTEYHEDGPTIRVVRIYKCGCGQMFATTSHYHWIEDETITNFPK